MKIKEIIKELEKYNQEAELFFNLIPKEDVGDDNQDIKLNWVGEICTSGLDGDFPFLDVGLTKD